MLDGMLLTQHLAAHSLESTHAKLKYCKHCMVSSHLSLSIPPWKVLFYFVFLDNSHICHKYDCF